MSIKHDYGPGKVSFMDSASIEEALSEMEADQLLNTKPILVKDEQSGLKIISFREKHLEYLKTHPKVNPKNYLANVKTMIRIRI